MKTPEKKKSIWIDLDNSPHVPFFSPIINELNRLGYAVTLTARDCSQTCGLADLFHLQYKRIGRHYGKHKIFKVAGTVFRALQLMRIAKEEGSVLALSHGSRAQMLSAWMLGVPSFVIMDYEYVQGFLYPTWIMMPEVITGDTIKHDRKRLLKYPGIKEDVYVPTFNPNPTIKDVLGLQPDDLVVTIRPPATEAHYHNPEAEILFAEVVNLLGTVKESRMVILPRNDAQKDAIQKSWSEYCATKKIIIPEHVVDGLNLLWHSDLVISGGGTMNREAAALGLPVYSIFRGKIGAVDKYLVKSGRLILLESVEDVHKKLSITKRKHSSEVGQTNGKALSSIVQGIVAALEAK
jgi:hypothetical protein